MSSFTDLVCPVCLQLLALNSGKLHGIFPTKKECVLSLNYGYLGGGVVVFFVVDVLGKYTLQ